MSYEDKIARATSLIEEINQQSDDKIDTNKFLKDLKKSGGVNEDMLQQCTWEELQKCGLPVLVARRIATIFREAASPQEKNFISEKKAQQMATRYLIEAYDPKDKKSAVHKRLAELSEGKKFLVFNPNNTVNVAASDKLLSELRDKYPERDTYDLDGRPVKVFAVGEDSTKKVVDENPLYIGRPLRPDGTCDQMNRSWEGVPTVVRQLLRLTVAQTGEVKLTHEKANDLLDMALAPDAEKKIRSRYKKASVLLDELVATDQAPTMKITLNADEAKPNDPFAPHRTY